jgi:hypothetical protein
LGKNFQETIKLGNGDSMMATKVGSLKRYKIQLIDSTLDITINEGKSVPDLYINLFSINTAISNGFNLSNIGTPIKIQGKWKDKLVLNYNYTTKY